MIFGAGPPSGFFDLPYFSCFSIGFCGIISAFLCYRYPKNDITYFWPIIIHSSQFRTVPLRAAPYFAYKIYRVVTPYNKLS